MARRSKEEIKAERAAAIARPKEAVIAQHVAMAGAVPLITPGDGEVTPGETRPEDEMVWGEVVSTDGQFRHELFSAVYRKNGRRIARQQEIATGVRSLIYKVLIPSIEFPQEEEIRISMTNLETEHALAGDMGPAIRKCEQMGCDRVVLRGRGLVFIRNAKKFRFIPDTRGEVRL